MIIFKVKRLISKSQSLMSLLSGSLRKGPFNGPPTKINILFSEPSSGEKLIPASIKKFEISQNFLFDRSTENDNKVIREMTGVGKVLVSLQVVGTACETVKITL